VSDFRLIGHLTNSTPENISFPSSTNSSRSVETNLNGLRNFRHEMWAAHGRTEGDIQWKETWGGDEWVAEAVSNHTGDEGTTGPMSATGSAPDEALGRLYLVLHAH
jgi:hypothetical protein